MKKQTKKFLPFWIILLVIGIIFLIIAQFIKFPAWLTWLVSLTTIGSTLIWMGIYFILGAIQKKRSSESFAGNRAIYERVSHEINEATSRYLKAVMRRGILRKSALYERPWFLVCGPEKSGKTELLSGSGLNIPLKYPSEKDGMLLESGSGISWNFANDAVWVDMPGMMMTDGAGDEWRATINALHTVRSERAVDGVLVVVDANRILNAEPRSVKELAGSIRKRIDDLIATWGIEFPVYLVISKSDSLIGFKEMFRDPAGKWSEQILGATLSGAQQKILPRQAFVVEYDLLCASLRDMRLRMLAREKDAVVRRLICRFVIHFEGIQQKMGDFVAELFKPSSYEGKPVFKGFYFTSCQSFERGEKVSVESNSDISKTIVNHPMNPHRIDMPQVSGQSNKKKRILSFFTNSLFRDIIPAGMSLVQKTQRTNRRERTRYYTTIMSIAAVAFLIGWYFFGAAKNAIALNNKINNELSQTAVKSSARTESYRILGKMGNTIGMLKKYEDGGIPLKMGAGMYKGDKVYPVLKKEYFSKVKRLVVGPAMRFLEFKIKGYAQSYGDLTGDDYNELYRYLKAYLSISEAVSGQLGKIDTTALRPVLLESIKYNLLASKRNVRLSENVEAVLNENVGLYMMYLKRDEYNLVQENQRLVSFARKRLVRLPSASVLYETVLNRVSSSAQPLTLNDILSGGDKGVLNSSQTISSLYTQEGWDVYISGAIQEACKDPYKIDWVVGTTKEQMPDANLDPQILYSGMVDVYYRDVKEKWITFLSSVSMEPFGDLERCGRILQKLGRNQSELLKFFEKVAELTQISEETESEGGESKLAGGLKKAVTRKSKTLKKMKKLGVEPGSFQRKKKGVSQLLDAFDAFRSFVRSDNGSFTGFKGYQDKILILSSKISSLEEGDGVVSLFNGKESDPLYSGWKYTNNELTGLPDELSMAIRDLLLSPMNYTGKSVSSVIKKQLNELWKNDIVTPFAKGLAGRYPFIRKNDEATYDDVMNYFRPTTGTFWGFYDRRLSAFVVKSGKKWEIREIGTVTVKFNPKLIETLKHAERIKEIFYQKDGTERIYKLSMKSTRNSKNTAVFTIAGGEHKVLSGGDGEKVNFRWPVESKLKGVSLKVQTNGNMAKDFAYPGQWGLFRLFDGARVNTLNQRSFVAKWQVNVQNTYMIFFACKVNVSGTDHPFTDHIFDGFDCPSMIAVE